MGSIIQCPKDNWPIGQLNIDGSFVGVCPKCRGRYGAQYGQLLHRRTHQVTLKDSLFAGLNAQGTQYELRMTHSSGKRHTLTTPVSTRLDDLRVSEGDHIGLLFQADADGNCKRLLRVINETTGKTQVVGKTDDDLSAAVMVGLIICFSAPQFFILLLTTYFSIGAASVLGLFIAILCGGLAGKNILESAQVSLTPQQEKDIYRNSILLKQKTKVVSRLTTLNHELDAAESQFHSIKRLYGRMQRFDSELYRSRIETLRSAAFLLRENIRNIQYLIEEYSKTIEMIDIEYDSHQVSHEFLNLSDSLIFHKLQEIKQAEARNQDITRQIQASDVVRRLTKSFSDSRYFPT
jgi:hypothetical protein